MTLKASHAPDSAEEITQIETLTYRRDGEKGNRDMKYGEFPMITREEMTDISMLKDHILYSDEIEDMPNEEQEQVYRYCKLHATFRACQANLKQLRYAVTRIYFGW